jgi:sirohydrochlorin ferrochelatase
MQQWTQDEAIAYECACEVITDLIAIHSRQIAEERAKPRQNVARIARLENEISRVFRERENLHVHDHAEVARIRTEYGALVRSWRAGHQAAAA